LTALLTVPYWEQESAFPPPITVVVARLCEKKGALAEFTAQALNPEIFLSDVIGILKFFIVIFCEVADAPAPLQKKHSLLT